LYDILNLGLLIPWELQLVEKLLTGM